MTTTFGGGDGKGSVPFGTPPGGPTVTTGGGDPGKKKDCICLSIIKVSGFVEVTENTTGGFWPWSTPDVTITGVDGAAKKDPDNFGYILPGPGTLNGVQFSICAPEFCDTGWGSDVGPFDTWEGGGSIGDEGNFPIQDPTGWNIANGGVNPYPPDKKMKYAHKSSVRVYDNNNKDTGYQKTQLYISYGRWKIMGCCDCAEASYDMGSPKELKLNVNITGPATTSGSHGGASSTILYSHLEKLIEETWKHTPCSSKGSSSQ
tara:strand:- start:371 stop:1150 length:780 start_codon:yes stop_codon:yes gene_type:complete